MSLPILGPVISVISEGIGLFRDHLAAKRQEKQARTEADIRVFEAKAASKIKILENQQAADIAWDNNALENSGWKDEWFTLVLSIPLILCFIPSCTPYVAAGFAALASTPDWYQTAVGLAIAASFGMKKFVDLMVRKKGA